MSDRRRDSLGAFVSSLAFLFASLSAPRLAPCLEAAAPLLRGAQQAHQRLAGKPKARKSRTTRLAGAGRGAVQAMASSSVKCSSSTKSLYGQCTAANLWHSVAFDTSSRKMNTARSKVTHFSSVRKIRFRSSMITECQAIEYGQEGCLPCPAAHQPSTHQTYLRKVLAELQE